MTSNESNHSEGEPQWDMAATLLGIMLGLLFIELWLSHFKSFISNFIWMWMDK